MLLNEILNSKVSVEDVKRDCKKFLNMVDIKKHKLYRGISSGFSEDIKKFVVPMNRKPKDTPKEIHDMMDKWMLQNLGVKFRSQSLFCTGDKSFAEIYGNLIVVIPIGNFKFAYSTEYVDLFLDGIDANLPKKKVKVTLKNGKEIMSNRLDISKVSYDLVSDIMEDSDFVVNSNLESGIKIGHEVMIHCKEYYSIPANSELLKEF